MIKDVIDEMREGRNELRGTPWGKIFLATLGVMLAIGLGSIGVGSILSTTSEAAAVAQQELGAKALLTKYTWLKEAHAQLEKKQTDIVVYRKAADQVKDGYDPKAPRSTWAREDRDAYNQRLVELAGVIASYNDLAAQYNAKMAEVNWRFTNVGQLPQGASDPLPREYAPYKTE